MTTTPTAESLSPWKVAQRERDARKAREKERESAKAKGKPLYVGCPDGRPHHYIIDEAKGPTSPGQCKYCGLPRVFKNSATDFIDWDDSATSLPNREFAL